MDRVYAMVDTFDKEERSWIMSRIRSKDTKPELLVRSVLHRNGFRFTVNGPSNRKLPGKPDIVLPKYHTVIFVNGCFWHGHEGCKHFRLPKSRTEWWKEKIEGNRRRDLRNHLALEKLSWRVVVLWSCRFDTREKRDALPVLLKSLLLPSPTLTSEDIAAEEKGEYRVSKEDR